ncbi:hypothetical protein ACC733_37810, partial [Rhizobium johnstonii]|uniref:hypothetical protein n=1 Tax=Rhizobium johnstonii TaxID=3019933 RepID=UPI003F9A5F69
ALSGVILKTKRRGTCAPRRHDNKSSRVISGAGRFLIKVCADAGIGKAVFADFVTAVDIAQIDQYRSSIFDVGFRRSSVLSFSPD